MSAMYLLLCRSFWKFLRDMARVGGLVCLMLQDGNHVFCFFVCFLREMVGHGGTSGRGSLSRVD